MSTGSEFGKNVPFDPTNGSVDLHSGIRIQRAPVARHLQERKLRRSLERKLADAYVTEEDHSNYHLGDLERKEMDLLYSSPGNHQRAAVEFVMELAGKHTVPVTEKIAGCQSLLHADEIPVPMFSVDFDMRCVLWNKRAADLTGWTESEIFAMPGFHHTLFSSNSSSSSSPTQSSSPSGRDLTEAILKGAFDGPTNAHEVWTLRTKWGRDLKVLVVASPRTDAKGVSGALCVIMPLGAPAVVKPPGSKVDHCNVKSMDEVSQLDLEEDDQLSDDGVDQFLSALDSPLSERGANSMEMFAAQRSLFADQANLQSEGEGTSVCSQDWCKSDQGSQSIAGGGGSGLEPSSLTRARVMVVDPRQRGRKSLTLLLERCGFEVSCACSATEALWRFEQSMHDPEGFSMVFINLSLARAENYDLVHELRCMEQAESGNTCLTSPALIVAVTDLDRWDISNTDGLKKKDMAAGVDEVITCPSRVQQLRDTLTTLGVPIDHLDYNKSPRAVFSSWNNTPVLAR